MSADTQEEAAIRDALTQALEGWLRASGKTQTEAAAVLGTALERISEIKHGKTRRFRPDLLVRLATRAGLRPTITITTRQ